MTNYNIDIELIEKYLRNELSDNELTDFNNRLKSDNDFMEKFKQMKALEHSVRNMVLNEKFDMLKEYEQELTTEDTLESSQDDDVIPLNSKSNYFNLKNISIGLAFTASVILGLIFIPGLKTKNTNYNQIALKYFEPFPADVIKRSESQNISALQKKAYSLYGINEFKKSAPLLAELCDSGDNKSCFFAGIALLGNGEPQKALILFEKSGLPFKADAINWYKGLCHYMLKDENAAKETWRQIGEESSYFQKVQEVISGD